MLFSGGALTVVSELESALEEARSAPYEGEFRARVEMALALAEAYLSAGRIEEARAMLGEEVAFAEKIFEIVQAAGTREQRRAAAAGYVQLRDRSRQLSLIGSRAPEILISEWIQGEAVTLEELCGRVVLLEFWATWCQPCQAMFGKLRQLDEEHRARGLEILALTRYYYTQRSTARSQAEELELVRKVVTDHNLKFRIGIAPDERAQELYGATGLPVLTLIDRRGFVRDARFGGGDDARFNELLGHCLNERV